MHCYRDQNTFGFHVCKVHNALHQQVKMLTCFFSRGKHLQQSYNPNGTQKNENHSNWNEKPSRHWLSVHCPDALGGGMSNKAAIN